MVDILVVFLHSNIMIYASTVLNNRREPNFVFSKDMDVEFYEHSQGYKILSIQSAASIVDFTIFNFS